MMVSAGLLFGFYRNQSEVELEGWWFGLVGYWRLQSARQSIVGEETEAQVGL